VAYECCDKNAEVDAEAITKP